jgi:hypothetical protein
MTQRKGGTDAPVWLGTSNGDGEVFGGVRLWAERPAAGTDDGAAVPPEADTPAPGSTAKAGAAPSRGRPGLLVSEEHHAGWVRASDRLPDAGETVYCTGGEGTVVSLHGKTGNGSRLIEIRLASEKASFFAAASNVLVKPR